MFLRIIDINERFNSSSKPWAFPYITLTHTSFIWIKKCINKTEINEICHDIMSYKIPHDEKKWPWVIWIMRTWPCQTPFQFLPIIWSIIIFYPLRPWKTNTWISYRNICQSPPKGVTFDDLLYWSIDTWVSKRKVKQQEGVINKGWLCMVMKTSLYNKQN